MRSKLWTLQGARACAAVMVALSAAVLIAQERPRAPAPEQGQAPRRITANRPVDQASTADHVIAQCLAIGNAEEAALSTLAASKSQNPEVKQFAEMLSKDHGQFVEKLQPFGAQRIELSRARGVADADADGKADRALDRREAPRTAERRAGREDIAERRTADSRDGFDFLHVKREMAEKCLETAQKNWNEAKSPQEADMCYVGSQVVLHQQMIDGQQVLRKYASPELQAVIDQGIATSQSHLEQAKKLAEQLSHNLAAKDAPRDSTN